LPKFWVALSQRKSTFLAETPWITIPYESYTKTHREVLQDLHLQIPDLLECADQIKHINLAEGDVKEERKDTLDYSQEARQCRQSFEFLRDCDTLIQDIDSWLEVLQNSEGKPLWWYSERLAAGSHQFDSIQPMVEGVLWTGPQISSINFASAKIGQGLWLTEDTTRKRDYRQAE
jgi:hypothetical protein